MATPPSELATRKTELSAAKRALLQQRIKATSQAARTAAGIPAADRSGELRLSHAQERLWFLGRLTGDSRAYHVPALLHIRGPLNPAALADSLNAIVARHEVLRTVFPDSGGVPRQAIRDELQVMIPVTDVADVDAAKPLIGERVRAPFDVANGPLIRAELFRIAPDDHLFLLCLHHIATDGWSMDLLREEMVAGYRAACGGTAFDRPPLPLQYADYAEWQRTDGAARVEKGLEYWREQLAGAPPVLTLQSGATRPAVQTFSGARTAFGCGSETMRAVQALANETGATPFMVALAAFNATLMRYTGQRDFVVGTPVSGRTHPQIQKLIGCFVNTVAIRSQCDGATPFRDLVERVRRTTLEAFDHQDVPFEKVVDAVKPDRELGHEPVCQVVFTCRENPVDEFELAPGTNASILPYDDVVAKFDLVMTLILRPDGIEGAIDYNRDLYDAWFIDQFAEHYRNVLEQGAASPDSPVHALQMLGETERARILETWNNTALDVPEARAVHRLIEDAAAACPDTVALQFDGRAVDYCELNERANGVAQVLLQKGLKHGSLVVLGAARGIDAVVGACGILKAGGAFVPVDPSYPADRVAFMIDDAAPALVLAEKAFADTLDIDPNTFVSLEDAAASRVESNPTLDLAADSLAYAIYTSGSTGKPKAALLEHAGLYNLMHAQRHMFDITPGMRILQFAPLSFDAWVWEFVMALCNGATLCIPNDSERTGADLARYIDKHEVEAGLLPPSVLGSLPDDATLSSMRVLFSGGEACRRELVKRWAPGRTFFNAYGPTEATVVATAHRCTGYETEAPPIGRPIANTRAYVLDSNAQPVPPGVEGELYVGGAGVARGYHNRPDLDAQCFIDDPFAKEPGARMYRTGDRVQWTPEGDIIYVGRADNQVKVRGFRIELGEIEAAIRSAGAVRDCAAIVEHANTPEARIAAFVELHAGANIGKDDLRSQVKRVLPAYMTPGVVEFVDALPRTPNDKIDTRALLSIERDSGGAANESRPPQTELERRIARAWSAVLNVEQVGVDDNFFDLGGHSLLAVKLVSALETEGVTLTLQQVFEHPTVASMAVFVEGGGRLSAATADGRPVAESLIPIQPNGSGTPLFVIAPAGGVIFPYFHLSHLMGEDRPIYGLQDPVVTTKGKPFTTHEDYVDYYRGVVETVQPDGPYQVLGWSMGGSIAYEMARAWEADGKPVSFIGLVDTRIHAKGPLRELPWPRRIVRSIVIVTDAAFALHTQITNAFYILALRALKPKPGEKPGVMARVKRGWASFWLKTILRKSQFADTIAADSELFDSNMPTVIETLLVLKSNGTTGKNYMPGAYGGKVTLIRASERVRCEPEEPSPTYGWENYAREVELHVVNGNHVQLFSEPTVHETAAVLRDALQRASQPD